MEIDRRSFLQKAGLFTATTALTSLVKRSWSKGLQKAIRDAENISPSDLASDVDIWYYIQQSFTVSPSIIYLNNGGVSPAAETVQDAMKRYYDYRNESPGYEGVLLDGIRNFAMA